MVVQFGSVEFCHFHTNQTFSTVWLALTGVSTRVHTRQVQVTTHLYHGQDPSDAWNNQRNHAGHYKQEICGSLGRHYEMRMHFE